MNTDAVPATLVVWGGVGLFIGGFHRLLDIADILAPIYASRVRMSPDRPSIKESLYRSFLAAFPISPDNY